MRILVLEASAGDERADLGQFLYHRLVGARVAALVVEDAGCCEKRDVRKIRRVFATVCGTSLVPQASKVGRYLRKVV